MTLRGFAFLASALATTSNAAVYAGNPKLTVYADHTVASLTGGTAEVDRIVLHDCDGSTWTDHTDVSFDPSVGATWDIPAGDWCSVVVRWADSVVLDGVYAGSTFQLTYDEIGTQLSLDPAPGSTALTPYEVTSGSQPPGHPRLYSSVD